MTIFRHFAVSVKGQKRFDRKTCVRQREQRFYVSEFTRKRIDGIVDSFATFQKNRAQEGWQLEIIGDGVLREKLEQQVRTLGLENSVCFAGRLNHEQLMPVLAGASALLVNTCKDNSMVSIVESIAAGTPIVTTSVPFNSAYNKREKLGIVKVRSYRLLTF